VIHRIAETTDDANVGVVRVDAVVEFRKRRERFGSELDDLLQDEVRTIESECELVFPEGAKRLLAADQLEVVVAQIDHQAVEDDPSWHPGAAIAEQRVLGCVAVGVAVGFETVVHAGLGGLVTLRDRLLVAKRRSDFVGGVFDAREAGDPFEDGLEGASLSRDGNTDSRHCRREELDR
jgi:hypothetical protein